MWSIIFVASPPSKFASQSLLPFQDHIGLYYIISNCISGSGECGAPSFKFIQSRRAKSSTKLTLFGLKRMFGECSGHKWILRELLDPSKNRALRLSKSSMQRAEMGKVLLGFRWFLQWYVFPQLILFKKPAQVPFIVYKFVSANVALEKVTEGPKKDHLEETVLLVLVQKWSHFGNLQ